MKPAAFEYLRPASLAEALGQLARGGEGAKLIAGGQSLGPMMNMRLAQPRQLVDLNDLTELSYAREQGGWVEVGALTRHYQVAESPVVRELCPLLAQAAQTIGHYAIRQRGTLGGSLAHADPAAQFVLAAITLGARLKLVREGGQREVAAADFFLGPMTTALAPGELLLSTLWPKVRAGEGAALRLFNRRRGDYARDRGVTLIVENVFAFRRAADLWPVMDRLDHPAIGCAWNVRSAWQAGEKTPEFLAQIDRALASVASTPPGAAARDRAVVALVGIRRAFFPDAPDYQPAHPTREAS